MKINWYINTDSYQSLSLYGSRFPTIILPNDQLDIPYGEYYLLGIHFVKTSRHYSKQVFELYV